ncbi:PRA1 family protein [Cryptosporidium andersoni]|uniref:PRA1 family protein n=1 Tax=Cryptosporidium andersoni TaxID=117008 RepID=A0A1J4MVI3_9CRYT|nr:PRA1 family protein [Cryptosporidium andersoni]
MFKEATTTSGVDPSVVYSNTSSTNLNNINVSMQSDNTRLNSKSLTAVTTGNEYNPAIQQFITTWQGLRTKIQNVTKRKLRSWDTDFFMLSSFQKVSQPKEIADRMEKNIRYFFLNYIIIIIGMTLLALILNPISLIIIVLAIFALAFVSSQPTDTITLPGGNSITKIIALYIIGGITTFGIILFSGALLFSTLAISIIIVCIHAASHIGKNNYDQVNLDSEV